jgi:hypothetical protein
MPEEIARARTKAVDPIARAFSSGHAAGIEHAITLIGKNRKRSTCLLKIVPRPASSFLALFSSSPSCAQTEEGRTRQLPFDNKRGLNRKGALLNLVSCN